MFRTFAIRLAAITLLPLGAASALADEGPAPVSVKVDRLSPRVATAVQEKARLGVDELRRYVERTRMIHALYLPDLVQEGDGTMVASAAPAVQQVQAKAVIARGSAVSAAKTRLAVAGSRQKSVAASAKPERMAGAQPVKALARAGAPSPRA
jgi:hypothetical protein